MCVFAILVDWWRSYGGRAIDLQRFAKRIVSLCASSSGCERNWSTFEFVSQFVASLCLFSSTQFVAFMCLLISASYLFILFALLAICAFVDPYKEKEPVTTQEIE